MNKPVDNTYLYLLALFVFSSIVFKIWVRLKIPLLIWYFQNRNLSLFLASALLMTIFILFYQLFKSRVEKNKFDAGITNGKNGEAVYAGLDENKKPVYINLSYRRMHAQVVGTTNAGKTESVIIPWIIDDIENKRGLVLIDGKSDKSLLDKLYAYAVKANRTKDFRVFSLSDYNISHTYNPLTYGTVDQVTEKVFNSFEIENEYYKNVQFDIFKTVLTIFKESKTVPTFLKMRQSLTDVTYLKKLAEKTQNQILIDWTQDMINMNKETRREQISGIVSHLGHFSSAEVAPLFNTELPSINIKQVMEEGLITVFQLPVLRSPILGKAVAKMVLQDIQCAVSERHSSGNEKHLFMGVYLDDFSEYLTKTFVSVLNKSRSANVGVTFAHQAVGDLEGLGLEVKNQIQTNTNLKVFMRTNEPESAEYFSKTIGTKLSEKVTKRQRQGLLGKEVTGEGSLREAEEFIYHPNVFKRELGLGEAIMILTHERGAKPVKIKFGIRDNLEVVKIPPFYKKKPELLKIDSEAKKTNLDETIKENELAPENIMMNASLGSLNANQSQEVSV